VTAIQVLETPRLILRHLAEGDEPFVLELLNDPGFLTNIGDRGVRDLEGARRYIEEGPAASYRVNGFGLWLTALKATGEPIGICGLVKRDGLDHADVGYAILERHSGKGYATEAAAATLDYARSAIGLGTVVAITTPDNTPSQAVLAKIGLKPAGTIRLPGRDDDSAYFTT
jgi:RimJ/RimL family protein N-acetyltransferase